MIARTGLPRLGIAIFLTQFVVLSVAFATSTGDKPGCSLPPLGPAAQKYYADLIARYGGKDLVDPPEVRPTSSDTAFVVNVRYADNTIAGCAVHLRSYNGRLVGDTIRAKPGDTIFIQLGNMLPSTSDTPPEGHAHMGNIEPFSFNITNLHTHGLHTSPKGNGDNVLLEVLPGRSQEYRITIPANHPSGIFWYHAHFHGTTAIQLSSGMAGAIVVEGSAGSNRELDNVPEVKAATQHILMLQQLRYGADGTLEDFAKGFLSGSWTRGITVNGQLVPTIRMRPGEVQRWRIVHAGVEENINLSLDGHKLYEIAADGIALGRIVGWPGADPLDLSNSLVLGPGYRTDVLVQADRLADGEIRREYFLRDGPLPPTLSLQSAMRAIELTRLKRPTLSPRDIVNAGIGKPSRLIARILVEGDPISMKLPTNDELAGTVPVALKPIRDTDLTGPTQNVALQFDRRTCASDGQCAAMTCDPSTAGCMYRYMVNDRLFNMSHVRVLKLGDAAEWQLTSRDVFAHPFHIHVNPFQMTRLEPNEEGKMVSASLWKDTVSLPTDGTSVTIRTRYADFDGTFVLHCHILPHEDMGMMELVRIVP